ncbi:TonB-dependent receptor [Hyphomonas beringensis]|nr:TonB-dependent receptor [Hyphomonas beringensis]
MKRTVATLLLGMGAFSAAGHAFAQEQEDEPHELDVVVVKGEKVERSLQDTVSSVAVLSSVQLEEKNIITLGNVFDQIANVTETYPGAGFTIRGVSNRNVSGGGASGLATVFLDGAALPDAYITGAPTDMWDIDQVEVLRGPQSTLQGRNTLAGAVIINTVKPTYDWDLRGRVTHTDHRSQTYSIAGGGPIIEDQLAFRVSAEYKNDKGFVQNVTRNTEENAKELSSGRIKLLWEPESIPELTAGLSYSHSKYDGGYMFSYSRADVDDVYNRRIDLSDEANTFKRDSDFASLNLSYDLNDVVTLNSITAWSSEDISATYDLDYTAKPQNYGGIDESYETFSQELRANYETERLTGLVGLYYSNRERPFVDTSLSNVVTPVGTISALLQGGGVDQASADALAALYAADLPIIPVDYRGVGFFKTENYALFADGTYAVTPKLDLLAGFRYDYEEFTQTAVSTTDFVGTYPDPADYGAPGSAFYNAIIGINAGVAGLVASAEGSVLGNEPRTFEAFLPKAGLTYHWTDDLSTAFLVQRGYRSGGSTYNVARASVVPYDQEYTWNYEASLRSSWLDGRLTANANVYYTDWKDQQVTVYFGLNEYDYNTVNAGKSTLYGAELDTSYRVNDELNIYGSVGYSKTKFDEFELDKGTIASDLTGTEFAFAPHWTSSIGGHYETSSGYFADISANYRSSQYSTVAADQALGKVDGRVVVNANAGYDADTWRLSVFVNNVFDEEYLQYYQVLTSRVMVGDPRVVGVTLGFDF